MGIRTAQRRHVDLRARLRRRRPRRRRALAARQRRARARPGLHRRLVPRRRPRRRREARRERLRGVLARHPEQAARAGRRRGARQDRRPDGRRPRHPEAPARAVRAQGSRASRPHERVTIHKPPPPTVASRCRCRGRSTGTRGSPGPCASSSASSCRSSTSRRPRRAPCTPPDFLVTLVGKLTCYAIVAVAMDLVWGYAGILSLCHAHVLRPRRLRDGHVPDARHRHRGHVPEQPARLHGLPRLEGAALVLARLRPLRVRAGRWRCVVPGVVAFVFGFFAFRSRIGGVYFSIVTQAMTYAAMLLFFRNATGFGGNNGLTDFKRILGYPLREPSTRAALCALTRARPRRSPTSLCRAIVASRAGRVLTAMRDAEAKVRFSGYNPVAYKLFAWTLSADALRPGRRALRAAGRHREPERDAAVELRRDRDLGRGRRPRDARRRDPRRVPRQRHEELAHRRVPHGVALLPRRPLRLRDARAARAASSSRSRASRRAAASSRASARCSKRRRPGSCPCRGERRSPPATVPVGNGVAVSEEQPP